MSSEEIIVIPPLFNMLVASVGNATGPQIVLFLAWIVTALCLAVKPRSRA